MSREIDMLYMHCQHDGGFLKYVVEDYVRLRELEAKEWGRAGEAIRRFNNLIRTIKELEGGE
jgi:hypothetical protein